MDEEARKKYCGIIMFDIPPPASKVNDVAEMPLVDEITSSFEKFSIKTKDNFALVKPTRVNHPKTLHIKSSTTSMTTSFKKIPRPPNAFILYRHVKNGTTSFQCQPF